MNFGVRLEFDREENFSESLVLRIPNSNFESELNISSKI